MPGRLLIANKPIEPSQALQYPTIVWELRIFLELCNIYRLFVATFTKLPSPLNKNLIKEEPSQFVFRKVKLNLANMLEKKLIVLTVLVLPRENGHGTIHTGACDT